MTVQITLTGLEGDKNFQTFSSSERTLLCRMFSLSCQDGEILRFLQVTILCVIDSATSSYDLNACAFAYSTPPQNGRFTKGNDRDSGRRKR